MRRSTGAPEIFFEECANGRLVQATDRPDLDAWSIYPSPDGRFVYLTAGQCSRFFSIIKVVALLGTRVAETILASGHVRPHEEAANMEASDPIKDICKKYLQVGALHIWNWRQTPAAIAA